MRSRAGDVPELELALIEILRVLVWQPRYCIPVVHPAGEAAGWSRTLSDGKQWAVDGFWHSLDRHRRRVLPRDFDRGMARARVVRTTRTRRRARCARNGKPLCGGLRRHVCECPGRRSRRPAARTLRVKNGRVDGIDVAPDKGDDRPRSRLLSRSINARSSGQLAAAVEMAGECQRQRVDRRLPATIRERSWQ